MTEISVKNINQIDTGFTLLTISQNKANYFLNYLAKYHSENPPTNYMFPEVMQVHTWLNKIYKAQPKRKIVISKQQSQTILTSLILEQKLESEPEKIIDLVKTTLTTINTIINYKVNLKDLKGDIKILVSSYQNYLDANNYTDSSFLLTELVEMQLPEQDLIILDSQLQARNTPILNDILNKFNNVKRIKNWTRNKSINIFSAVNINSYFKHKPKQAAVFVPALDSKVDTIKRLIQNNLDDSFAKDIHICTNTSLIKYPIINGIFLLLNLDKDFLSAEDILRCINNPYLFNPNKDEISKYIQTIKDSHETLIAKSSWLKIFNQNDSCEKLLEIFQINQNLPSYISLHEYAAHIIKILNIASWPGKKITTIKPAKKFISILKQLHQIKTSLPKEVAKLLFREIIQNYYVLDDNPNAPWQILDYQEALDREFENIILWDIDASQLPNKESNNLSDELNKKYNILLSDEKSHAKQKEQLKSLIDSVPNVYIYYLTDNLPSMLLAEYPKAISLEDNTPSYRIIDNNLEHDTDPIIENIPLNDTEKNIGTYQLKEFQTCHFKSFAKFRLKLAELEMPSLGLNAKEKGIIVHEALQRYYTENKDITLTDIKHEQLNKNIRELLTYYLSKKPLSGNNEYITTTTTIISQAIVEFINLDATRPKFTVKATESKHKITISDINIRCIIDRIDEVATGKYILIDYKTGATSPSHWFDIIKDPQMPIYSLNYKESIVGLAFAKINHIQAVFSGITSKDNFIEGTMTKYKDFASIGSMIDYWQTEITTIVSTYATGSIRLTPSSKAVCKTCDYQRLCRIWDGN